MKGKYNYSKREPATTEGYADRAYSTKKKPSKLDLLKRIEQNIGKQHGNP